jgi:hypothetical protein
MSGLTCLFVLERVTGLEPALSAWESVQSGPSIWPDLRSGLSVSDHESPRFTLVNGPLMAGGLITSRADLPLFGPDKSPVVMDRAYAAACPWSLLLLSAWLPAALGALYIGALVVVTTSAAAPVRGAYYCLPKPGLLTNCQLGNRTDRGR